MLTNVKFSEYPGIQFQIKVNYKHTSPSCYDTAEYLTDIRKSRIHNLIRPDMIVMPDIPDSTVVSNIRTSLLTTYT